MMRRCLLVFGVVLLAVQVGAGETPAFKTMKDKLSYATGVDMVRSFQRQGVEVDNDIFLRGVKDALSGGKLLLSEGDINKLMKVFMAEQKMKVAERKRQQSERLRKQRQTERLRKQRENAAPAGTKAVEPGSTVK